MKKTTFATLALLTLGASQSFAVLAWTVGDSTVGGRQAPEITNFYGTTGTTTFVQENNSAADALPGDPNSPATNQQADDDFFFAGDYMTQVDGGAAYLPVGIVASTEIAIERAVTGNDTRNRIHFNFSGVHTSADIFTVSFGMIDLDDNLTGTGQYNFAINVNGVNVGNVVHTNATIGTQFTSNPFTLATVGGTAGANDDNYVELVSNNAGSTSRWSNFDYIQMDYTPVPEPSSIGFIAIAAAGIALIRRRRR